MLPGENGEVRRLARPAAFRTGEQSAAFRDHFEVQFMRPRLDIKPLTEKFPRLAQAKPEREHILRFHRRPPCRHPTSMQAATAPFNSDPIPFQTLRKPKNFQRIIIVPSRLPCSSRNVPKTHIRSLGMAHTQVLAFV